MGTRARAPDLVAIRPLLLSLSRVGCSGEQAASYQVSTSMRRPAHPAVDRARDLRTDRARADGGPGGGPVVRPGEAVGQARRHAVLGDQAAQLLVDRLAQRRLVEVVHAVDNEPIDVEVDARLALHVAHSLISASVSGRSSLRYSLRAARSRCDMRTGSSAPAAMNAAASAIERMLPPATCSCASFCTSTPSSGACFGNARRQISARWAWSGNGNWTMKRMRRTNAWSSESGRFVVRIARPRYASIRWSR